MIFFCGMHEAQKKRKIVHIKFISIHLLKYYLI